MVQPAQRAGLQYRIGKLGDDAFRFVGRQLALDAINLTGAHASDGEAQELADPALDLLAARIRKLRLERDLDAGDHGRSLAWGSE